MTDKLWHQPPETPDVFRPHPIVVIYEAGDKPEQIISTDWHTTEDRFVNRWCYTDELIASVTVLQRKLDKAMDVLRILEEELRCHNHAGTADLIKRDIKEIEDIKA